MKTLICCLALSAAALSAQSIEFFQSPAQPQIYQFEGGSVMAGSYLGVYLAELDSNRARELKLKETYGVEISRLQEGAPAEKAGLKVGDVILEYNGQRVEGMEQFGRLVRETPAGREVKLLVSRGGVNQTIAATVGTRKLQALGGNLKDMLGNGFDVPEIHIPDMPQVFNAWHTPMFGVEAESLGSQLAGYFGVKEGVLIRSVVKGGAADKAGIKAGDVVTKVDGTSVATPNELSIALRSASSKKAFPVELVRDRKETSVNVTIEDGGSEKAAPRARVVRSTVKM